jgi:PAS domain S-box-containing protein
MNRQDDTWNGLAKGLAKILSCSSETGNTDPDRSHLTSAIKVLSGVIDQNGLGVSLADSKGNLMYVNETCATMHGWTPDDLLGQPASILYASPESRKTGDTDQGIQPIVARSGEYRQFRRDGSVFRAVSNSVPFQDNGGETIGALTTMREVSESEATEQALQENRNRLEDIVDSVTDHIIMLDEELYIVWANRVARDLFGRDTVGRKCYAAFHGRDRACRQCIVEEAFADGEVHEQESQVKGADGLKRTYWSTAKVAERYENDRPKMVVQVSRDITERKRSEKQIKASLEEKEALLREIHHRVKNNLQVISSLLRLQSRYCDNKGWRETFNECEQRVQSISLVYEKLHGSEDSVGIDFHSYCKSLVPHLYSIFDVDPQRIRLTTDIDRITVGPDSAVPCGLIVNELLSNCLKHAFPDSETGHIEVSLKMGRDNLIELAVRDDGIGLPPDFDLESTDTLGLRLVKTLAKQLHATTQVDSEKGTRFTIAFSSSLAPVS